MKIQGRHCERSEAIQSFPPKSGLLRRFAPRNDGLIFIGWISSQALRMRSQALMVRSASSRVSNHDATEESTVTRTGKRRSEARPEYLDARGIGNDGHARSRAGVDPSNERIFSASAWRRRIVDHHAQIRPAIDRERRIFERNRAENRML
jgi:hypothetical protein